MFDGTNPLVTGLLQGVIIVVLTFLLGLFSYVHRLYQEKGRGRTRRTRAHLEYFHDEISPRLKMKPRQALQTFGLLSLLTLMLTAVAIGFAVQFYAGSPARAVFETAFFVVLELLVVYEFAPLVLLTRSQGGWLLSLILLLRGFSYAVVPLQIAYGFALSVLRLVEEDEEELPAQEEQAQAIEDLVEEGQERGIFEKEDVALIASVLEFADKTARDIMTPRPEIVGIKADKSVADLRAVLARERFSRVLVYGNSVDEVRGVVNVHDVLKVPEAEAATRRVAELVRPVLFVPETKRVVELVSQLQQGGQQIVVVMDEYGNVAGLLTTKDLAEEVIGEISDADQVRHAEVLKTADDTYLVRAGVHLEKFEEAIGQEVDAHGVVTLAGLVHNWFGYVPRPGESIERDGLRVEVLEATPRRVVRLRVTVLAPVPDGEKQPARAHQR